MDVTMEKCTELMNQYEGFKKVAEQHQFPLIFMMDLKLQPAYKDLQTNWSEEHGAAFIRAMQNSVFPKLGIGIDWGSVSYGKNGV